MTYGVYRNGVRVFMCGQRLTALDYVTRKLTGENWRTLPVNDETALVAVVVNPDAVGIFTLIVREQN